MFFYDNISLSMAPAFFFAKTFILPLPLQYPLDYISGIIEALNMSFGDVELHDHFNLFLLV